jgi:hypothetical protein
LIARAAGQAIRLAQRPPRIENCTLEDSFLMTNVDQAAARWQNTRRFGIPGSDWPTFINQPTG